jgi:hypothetical protein
MYLNIINTIYDKHIANMILKWQKTETISPKVRNKTRIPLTPFLFNIVLEFLVKMMK